VAARFAGRGLDGERRRDAFARHPRLARRCVRALLERDIVLEALWRVLRWRFSDRAARLLVESR
jgi:hypothetical protein